LVPIYFGLSSGEQLNFVHRIFEFYNDKVYFSLLVKIAIPIALQNAVSSSLNMVGSLMIGQKGAVAVAAVGLAGQVFFLLNLLLFGIGSGAAMFTAQLWGKRDIPDIRRVLSLALILGTITAGVFFILAEFFPSLILGIYTRDIAVIEVGSQYLKIFAWSFFFFAITFSYALTLRSIGDVKVPVIVSIGALTLNAVLTYGFVFGKFGFPEMGVPGAAVALVIARVVECVSLLLYTYIAKSPAAVNIQDFFRVDFHFIGKILIPVWPIIANEFLWSMGITTYYIIYGRMGTNSIAAMNIVSTIDQLALVILFGLTSATAVIVGNRIGSSQILEAYQYAGRSLGLGAFLGLILGLLVILFSPFILSLYNVNRAVIYLAQNTLIILGCFIWLRALNMINVVGILRAGGDTKFSLILDGVIIWVLGVPMAFVAGFILDLPVYYVYLFLLSEEAAKCIFGMRRFFSKRWIHNLVKVVIV
jgi:putative MATE family efflux protein